MRVLRPTAKFYISTGVTAFLFWYSVLLLLPGSTLLREPDTFWQIRIGQWILENANVPVVDFYSYTAAGKRWISGQWLSEILLALAFNIADWRGIVILSAASCSAIILLVFLYLVRNLRFSIAVGWMALTALAITPHFLARPHIFSYILLSIWVIILLDSYDSKDFRPSTLILSLLMILWANMHGSFTFGLLLLYVFTGFSCYEKFVQRDYVRCRNLVVMLLAVSLSALLTPYGVYSALLVLQTMNMKFVQANTIEWEPPNFQTQTFYFYLFYLIGLFGVMAGCGIRLRGPRLIAFSILMFFGLSYIRGLVMLFLLAPFILARPILARAPWFRPAYRGNGESVGALDPVLVFLYKRPVMMPTILFAVAAVVTAYSWHEINVGPPKSISPNAAIHFVRRNGITGNVFNSSSFGGYLIFAGIPTFIDGRIPPYTDDFVRRYLNAVTLKDIDDAFRLLEQYKVRWALLQPELPLAKALARNAMWDEVYADNFSVVLVRR
jgi:hypothetical protein